MEFVQVKDADILAFAKNYLKRENVSSPLNICFPSNATNDHFRHTLEREEELFHLMGHPVRGHEKIIYNGELSSVDKHPEMLLNDVMPGTLMNQLERYVGVIYYLYVGQFSNLEDIQYAESVLSETKLPVIYVTDSYQYDKASSEIKQYMKDHFENVMVEE